MDVGKNNNNFKDRKPKYFNWNKYSHIAKKILEEEREGNLKIFQIWQRKAHSQRLQIKAINEEMEDSRGIRQWRQWRERQKTEFWRRSQVGMVQEIFSVNFQNKYIIPNWRSNAERELNMWANIKIKNRKNLKVKVLVDLGYTHIGIDKQLVKDKRIQTKPINFSFEVFNANRTKNREMTRVAPLEVKTNKHKE